MAWVKVGTKKLYGPIRLEDDETLSRLTHEQEKYIYAYFNGVIAIISHRREFGNWAGSTCTRQFRYACFR